VAIVQLPHLANFDEFAALAAEPRVQVRYVRGPEALRAPDLVILPGTKATIPDLLWLRERGLAERLRWLVGQGTPLLGVCGGYQMLGQRVRDPLRLESRLAEARGLGVLPLETELMAEKELARVRGRVRAGLPGVWGALGGARVKGYEIHAGRSLPPAELSLLELDARRDGARSGGGRHDGAVSGDGRVAGTYVHGVLEEREPRQRLVGGLAARRGFSWRPAGLPAADAYERLADILEATFQLDGLPSLRSL